MSLIDEFERIIAEEQAKRMADDQPNKEAPQTEEGLLAQLAASWREIKASFERRPRG
jgi:hypothetical protein